MPMPARSLALAVVVLVIPGCVTPSGAVDPLEPSAATSPVAEPAFLDVYAFDDLVTGASVPNPAGPGGLVAAVPFALRETFVLDAPMELRFALGDAFTGAAAARIEVVDPAGARIYVGDLDVVAGVVRANPVALDGTEMDDVHPAGEYAVEYYVAGAYAVQFTVEGRAPLA